MNPTRTSHNTKIPQKLKGDQTSMMALTSQPRISLPSSNQEQSQLQTFKDY